MNLVTDKYIRVLKTDGSHEMYSLHDVFKNADSIATVEYPIHERVTIISLLACIAQDAAVGKLLNDSDWLQHRDKIITSSCDYLLKHLKKFELYDNKSPFCQIAAIKENHADPFRVPVNEISLDRPFKDRTVFFDRTSPLWEPTDVEIANMILPYAMFDLGNIYKKQNTWDPDGKISFRIEDAPCSRRMLMVVEGENLLDTIWYHVFPKDKMGKLKMGKPFWLLNFKSQKDVEEYASTYCGHLLPIARSLLLDEKSRCTFQGETISSVGGRETNLWNECRHPMMIESTRFEGKKKVEVHGIANIDHEKEVWRQLGATMAINNDLGKLAWAYGHARAQGKLFIYVGGLSAKTGKSEILGPIESVFCIPRCDKNGWAQSYIELFKEADKICFRLKCAVQTYSEILGLNRPQKPQLSSKARRTYWSKMSNHIDILFKASDIESLTAAEDRRKWINMCWKEAFNVYDGVAQMYNGRTCKAYGLGINRLRN